MTEAVLFDFNGVLVDDESQHCDALRLILGDEGITLSREQYYAEYLGLDDRTGFVQAFQRAHRTLTTELLDRLVEEKSRIYYQLIERSLTMVPGAVEFVGDAAQRYRLGIVSGALRSEIDAVLSRTTIADRFEIIVAAGDVSRCKPDPAAFLAGLAGFNRSPKRPPIPARACVAIEDSLPGLAAARAAGMPCVMLATSHPADALRNQGAALVWDSLSGHAATELADL
jgi:HAD superfamily hydrolase (TIGR01509 family)